MQGIVRGCCLLMALAVCAVGQHAPSPVCVAAAKEQIPPRDMTASVGVACVGPLSAYGKGHAAGPLPQGLLETYVKAREAGDKAGLERVRGCALAVHEAERLDSEPGDAFLESDAVLAMLYARGEGPAGDLGLAEKFACEINDGLDDGDPLAQAMEKARRNGAVSYPLDMCRDWVGRRLNAMCLTSDFNLLGEAAEAEERRFEVGETAAERAAFARLSDARQDFFIAHQLEQGRGTTAAVQGGEQEDNDSLRAWVKLLKDLRAGWRPRFTEEEYRTADKSLNANYGATMKGAAEHCGPGAGCARPEEIRAAERAWLKYREAWVAYGALRWPGVAGDAWRAWLTLDRADALLGVD